MKETEEKPKSWIEEAWEYSRMAIENDLPTTIDAFYEYQRNKLQDESRQLYNGGENSATD